MRSLRKTVLQGGTVQLVGRVINALTKGLVILLLTRLFLQPDEYGLLFFAISILGVAGLFASLGFAGSVARYLAEYRHEAPSQIPHILSTGLRYNLLAISVVGISLLLTADLIAQTLGEPRLSPLLLVGIGYVVFQSLKKFASLSFQGFNRVMLSAVVGIVSNIFLVVFVIGFLLLGFGTLGALAGYVVASGVGVVVGLAILYRQFYAEYRTSASPEPGLSRRIVEYSLPLTLTRSANTLDRRIDVVLIGYFLTPVAVGFYTLGKQITEFVIIPATALGFTIAPNYGEQKAKENLSRAARVYETTFRHTLSVYLPAAAGMLLIAGPAIRIVFGANYLGAVPVVQVFSVYVILRAIEKITSDGLDYLGRAQARASVKGGTAAANFFLNLVMIPLFGIVGAAIATVLTTSLLVGGEVYIVYTELPLSPTRLVRPLGVVGFTTGGMAVVVAALLPYVSGIVSLLGVVLAGGIMWAGLAIVSGLFDIEHIRSILG